MTAAPQPAHHESSTFRSELAPDPVETPRQARPTLSVSAVPLSLKTRLGAAAEPTLLDPSVWGAEVDTPWWLPTGFRFFEPELS